MPEIVDLDPSSDFVMIKILRLSWNGYFALVVAN